MEPKTRKPKVGCRSSPAVLGNFTAVKARLVVNPVIPWITVVFGYRGHSYLLVVSIVNLPYRANGRTTRVFKPHRANNLPRCISTTITVSCKCVPGIYQDDIVVWLTPVPFTKQIPGNNINSAVVCSTEDSSTFRLGAYS